MGQVQIVQAPDLMETLRSLVGAAPVFLVWLIGILFALTRWRRHPKVSLIALIALGGYLLSTLAMEFLYPLLI